MIMCFSNINSRWKFFFFHNDVCLRPRAAAMDVDSFTTSRTLKLAVNSIDTLAQKVRMTPLGLYTEDII